MSRRSGQNGSIQKDGKWYVVRWWMDVEGQEKRRRMRAKICPISDPGKLSASERERKAKEIIAASGADSVEHFEKVVKPTQASGTTFREQSAIWLNRMRERRRKPIAPATLDLWERALANWLNPDLGDKPLGSIDDLAMKNLVDAMVKGGLGASAIRSYTNVVKRVIDAAVDEKGKRLLPRMEWNQDFIDMPPDNNPKRPCFTGDVVTRIIAKAGRKPKYQMLYTLCAASGLRFGEALGIRIENISPDASTIKIHSKAWREQVHDYLKTKNGKREVDLHPKVAAMLKAFVGGKQEGLLFQSKSGRPLMQTNILRRSLHPILEEIGEPKCGVHAFRRFRLTHIREFGVPRDLEHFWMGHEGRNEATAHDTHRDGKHIGDIYSMLKERIAFRKKWAEQLGLGFEIPSKTLSIGPNGPKLEIAPVLELAATA